jgi:hypothetical protein
VSAKVIQINVRLEAVWAEYIAARQKADASGVSQDRAAADHAFNCFQSLFVPHELRGASMMLGAIYDQDAR